ncbi:MAG: aminomethyl-transferring glycine dehydrogenase subunit GcvPA, partial [Chloroflexi bacterium]|nr:aminomethyl-transferring glycine dehydrogenase subunit GcvPA [Chloroflexota bacterium]
MVQGAPEPVSPHPTLPHPYLPHTADDVATMLARLGLPDVDALFAELPGAYRDPAILLPPALAEAEIVQLLRERAAENSASALRPHFSGAGAYRRFVPAIVPYLVSRSEFMTAYTPYQPEISQGTLQATFEFQSVVCELTGLDVANAGMYDVASATAEACLLAARVTGRAAVALIEPLHPHTVDVVRAYAYGAGLRVDVVTAASDVGAEHACLVAQQPDFLGAIADVEAIAEAAHAAGALCVVMADPFALGLVRAPGDAGADVVTGEGRDLAGSVAFGGPSLGLFAARSAHLRQLPGRIVGRTHELQGRDGETPRAGYVLTLQAREQFIRRERATSNISTGQALVALAFTIAVQALGPRGLREAAMLCYQRAHVAAARIDSLPGYAVVERGPWFQEFLLRGPLPATALRAGLAARGIAGGVDVSARAEPAARDALLLC